MNKQRLCAKNRFPRFVAILVALLAIPLWVSGTTEAAPSKQSATTNTTNSAPLTWFLEDVTFDSGATATGSFKYDAATNTYSDFNIIVYDSPLYGTVSFGFLIPSALVNSTFLIIVASDDPDLTDAKVLAIEFASPLTDTGGTVEIVQNGQSNLGTCLNPACTSYSSVEPVQSGHVTTGACASTWPINVSSQGQLNATISCYNRSGAGDYTINKTSDISLTTNTISLDNTMGANLTINGNSHKLDGANSYTPFKVFNGNLTIDNLTIENGQGEYVCEFGATSCGGAIYLELSSQVTLSNSTIQTSSADEGGAIYNRGGTVIVDSSTLANNSASNNSGAIYVEVGSTTTIVNSTVSNNSVFGGSGLGGGILSNGTVNVINSTFNGNSAAFGGGISVGAGTTTLSNSIIANSSNGGDCLSFGTLVADATNLDSDGSCDNAQQRTEAEINLGPLADNGGPTFTHALLEGSVAIDAGDEVICAANPVNNLDQRGVMRSRDASCDIGAYEVCHAATVVHVAPTGNNASGSDWTTAYTSLATALFETATCTTPAEIWVAAGIYTPGVNATDSFNLVPDVELYGGFAGTETARSERDWVANPTILSGDIDGDDITNNGVVTTTANISGTNSYHVVYADGTGTTNITTTTVIDGFTITAGRANGESFPSEAGGGFFCNGAGVGNVCSPTVNNVVFSGNRATFGGGMFNLGDGGDSSPSLNNVIFTANFAIYGGGLHNDGANGGNSNPTLNNVTLFNNGAFNGWAIRNFHAQSTLHNTIVWRYGTAITDALEMAGSSSVTIAHSLVEGSGGSDNWVGGDYIDGGGNIDSDPLFVSTLTSNLRLFAGSPAIDTGNNIYVTTNHDLDGNARIFGGTVDMGAYEFGSVPTAVELSGISSSPTVFDMNRLVVIVLAGLLATGVVVRRQNLSGV